MGRDALRLLPHLLGGLDDRGATHGRGAGAVGAIAEGGSERVRMLDEHVVHGQAQLAGRDLGHGRLVPLALRLAAGGHDHLAREMDADVGRLPHGGTPALAHGADPLGGRHAADLDIAGDAQAQQPAARQRLRLGCGQVLVARHGERALEGRCVVPGIDGQLLAVPRPIEAAGIAIREGVVGQEVAASDLRPVHADLGREQVHRPLHDVRRLRPTRAPVGIDEHGVGVHAGDLAPDVGDGIRARQHPPVQRRGTPGPMVESRPPRLAMVRTLRPVMMSLRVPATSMSVMWSRPWMVAR